MMHLVFNEPTRLCFAKRPWDIQARGKGIFIGEKNASFGQTKKRDIVKTLF